MTWAVKRQITILAIVAGFIGLVLLVFLYPKLNQPATCSDGKQNEGELGVDCGGPCSAFCSSEGTSPVVKWARAVPVTTDVYDAVAYVEHQNVTGAIGNISYEFRLYDADHTFILVRDGSTYIGANGVTAIFEGGIQVGSRVPRYTTFTFLDTPQFTRLSASQQDVAVLAHEGLLSDQDTKPKISGKITNASNLYGIDNISVAAIAYDKDDNAVGVSQTTVDHLDPNATSDVYFTWPNPFDAPAVRTELVPRFNILDMAIK